MGRASNRKKAKRATEAAESSKLKIVVCTYPERSLAPSLELLKAAVIYGDEVLLHSPTALLLSGVATIGQMEPADLIQLMRQVAPALGASGRQFLDSVGHLDAEHGEETTAAVLAALLDPDSPARAAIAAEDSRVGRQLDEMTAGFDGTRADLRRVVEEQLEAGGVHEILPAIEAGILRLAPVDDTEDLLESYLSALWSVLGDSRYHPLLDARIGHLVRAAVEAGAFDPPNSASARGRQVSAAGAFLARLPTFPLASMDEIVDIRSGLARPLVRFRGEMSNVSDRLGVDAFDPDFEAEAQAVWLSTVAPALLELGEAVEEMRLSRLFGHRAAGGGGVTGAVGGLVTALITHSALAVGMIGVGAGVVAAGAGSLSDRAMRTAALNKHPYYFLHRTEKDLSERTGSR